MSPSDQEKAVESASAVGALPVFISYARKSSRAQAEALQAFLGADTAFLDSDAIEQGDQFPETLADALLGAKVVVVFADEAYFRRWYCLWELRTALAPFLALKTDAPEKRKRDALASIIVALPTQDTASAELRWLPPLLRNTLWPLADDTGALAALVRARLAAAQKPLGAQIKAAGGDPALTRERLVEEAALPAPRSLAGFSPIYPLERPSSLHEKLQGRADDLWRIDFALKVAQSDETAGAALSGALEGAGGFGKTRLALEYVHRLGRPYYAGGIFWVDADVSEERLEEQFHGILCTLDASVPELVAFRKDGRSAAKELARALDEAAGKAPVLYVVDNVLEAPVGAALKPLKTWCPALGKVSLLVTSRVRLDLGTEAILALPVEPLAPHAAVALLTDGAPGVSRADPAWASIAEWVGYLPLALELLNRALKAKAITRDELLAAQREGPVKTLDLQMEALKGQVPSGSLRGVTDALNISYERLSSAGQQAARLLARLAPAPIPMALLNALGEEVASGKVRAELHARHFVTAVAESGVPLFGVMHRVLADFLNSRSPEPLDELAHVSVALHELMTPEACSSPSSWPLVSTCLPHAERIFRTWKQLASPNPDCVQIEVGLGLAIGFFFSARGMASSARKAESAALSRAQQVLGHDDPVTLTLMSNLAETLSNLGEYQQAKLFKEQVLEVRLRVLGLEHADTLIALGNLAKTLSELGEHQQAKSLNERVLESCRQLLGPEHPRTLTAMNNLAAILAELGEHQQAKPLKEQVLEARLRVMGPKDPSTLLAQANLAVTLSELGESQRAKALFEEVLDVRRRVLGPEHPQTLLSMDHLSAQLWILGERQEAVRLQQQALEDCWRFLGAEHPVTKQIEAGLAYMRRS